MDSELFCNCDYCTRPEQDGAPAKPRVDQSCPRRPAKSKRHTPKKQTARLERRRAKQDPNCQPGYKGFRGYES